MKLPLGFALVPNSEIVEGLRANVSKLQKGVNRRQVYIGQLTGKLERVKEQQALDRVYLDNVKKRAWLVVERPSPAYLRLLEEALTSPPSLDDQPAP